MVAVMDKWRRVVTRDFSQAKVHGLRVALCAVLGCSVGTACARRDPAAGSSSAHAFDAATQQEQPALSFEADGVPSAQVLDARWAQAAAGDEWAALQLSRTHSASDLLESIARGGPAAKAAVAAYPTSDRAWEARGKLCRLIPRYGADSWLPLIRALAETAALAERLSEVIEAEAAGDCAAALTHVEVQAPQFLGLSDTYRQMLFDHVQSARQSLASFSSGG